MNKFNKLAASTVTTIAIGLGAGMNLSPANAESQTKLERAIDYSRVLGYRAISAALTELDDSKALRTRTSLDGTVIVSQKGGPGADQPFAVAVFDPNDGVVETSLMDREWGIRTEATAKVGLIKPARKQLERSAKDGIVTAEDLRKALAVDGNELLEAAVTTPNMNETVYTVSFNTETGGAYLAIDAELAKPILLHQDNDFNAEIGNAIPALKNMYVGLAL